jgi:superfamily I DNA/RNA helicase
MRVPKRIDLTLDQNNVLRLIKNQSMLIVGGPGTGKSVLVLFLIYEMMKKDKTFQVLSFNKNLNNYLVKGATYLRDQIKLDNLFNRDLDDHIKTFDSWFGSVKYQLYPEYKPKDYFKEKYQMMQKMIDKGKTKKMFDVLIIDEGQDLPPVAHAFLSRFANQIIVLADVNQSLLSDNVSNLYEIKQAYHIFDSVYYLQDNYRNTKEIYELAKIFNQHPDRFDVITHKKGSMPELRLVTTIDEMIKQVMLIITKNPEKTVGVFLATQKTGILKSVKQFMDAVISKFPNYDVEQKSRISYYQSRRSSTLDFEGSYVHFMSLNTMKGLEYDIVICPNLEDISFDVFGQFTSNMYVAITRAKSDFIAIYNKAKPITQLINELMNHPEKIVIKELGDGHDQ